MRSDEALSPFAPEETEQARFDSDALEAREDRYTPWWTPGEAEADSGAGTAE